MSQIFHTQVMPSVQKMYRYALSILKEEDTAHDVVQDCLEKIWKKRNVLEEIHQPEAWVMRITRNQCYDRVKTNRFSISAEHAENMVGQVSAEEETNYSDQLKWLELTLNSLQDKQREVFHLRDVEGMTYQEIAEVLDISIEDVKVSLHRARKVVREKMLKVNNYGIAN